MDAQLEVDQKPPTNLPEVEFKPHPSEKVIPAEILNPEHPFATYLHSTTKEAAKSILENGLAGFKDDGLKGVAIPLGSTPEDRSDQIVSNHNNAPEIIMFGLPVRSQELRDLIDKQRKDEGIGFDPAIFSMEEGAPVEGLKKDPDVHVPVEFIYGAYNKQENTWQENPHYWENKLKVQAVQEGWTKEQFEKARQQKIREYESRALKRYRSLMTQREQESKEMMTSLKAKIAEAAVEAQSVEDFPEPRIP